MRNEMNKPNAHVEPKEVYIPAEVSTMPNEIMSAREMKVMKVEWLREGGR